MYAPEERQFSLDHATRRIEREMRQLRLGATVDVQGQGPCIARTLLHDAGGSLLTVGWGKGEREAARTGSLYEAMEHLLSARHLLTGAEVHPVEAVLAGLAGGGPGDMPLTLLADQIEETIACRRYTSLCGREAFDYPLVLSAPDYLHATLPAETFDHAGLRRYASNSGTAIGACPAEALLHALNECIERDALSLFLLTHFFHECDAPLYRVDPQCMPAHLTDLYDRACAAVDAPIALLDITADGPVSTCFAVALHSYPYPRPYGAGASLNPAHAARRALTELVQAEHGAAAADEAAQQAASAMFDDLAAWPRLRAALAMDIETLLRRRRIIATGLRERPGGELCGQIRTIAAALDDQGLHPGYALLRQSFSGSSLVNVVVPGMERFFLVTAGNVVLPGSRGQALRPMQ
ncbi:YcaO-like family protein [Stenotrophomonas sp. C3(2023)]|uniref:YcaO-like family protein n=1 Tax=Stenotrophomonas sp. C3(2023) TaxID=3080277 RepID=UPI00293C294C|nr:YcaO-like family protein [Stenotrophomonas sp. C3(2023)]MDV3469126.1 YcaO-like family protein [Stenotrophomonas sp. C3(2023)]